MYITINDIECPGVSRWENSREVVFVGDSLTNIDNISGSIGVFANNGFLLREDNPSNYERIIIRTGAITLSNIPENYIAPATLEQRIGVVEQTNRIAFRTMAESGEISEEIAAEYPNLFEEWEAGIKYAYGNLRSYEQVLYKCIIPHTSQEGWTPDVTNMWVRAANPTEEWPEWIQPISTEDAYDLGAKVSHNDKHWISTYDGKNVWEPGVFGWDEAE